MRITPSFVVATLFVGIGLAVASPARAQELEAVITPDASDAEAEKHEESWYREQQAYQPNTRAIIHEKAQVRAYQRQSRLASMAWYGMSNSRPMGAPTPFTSRYSPVWEMPGGRPFSWYPQSRPGYVMYWR